MKKYFILFIFSVLYYTASAQVGVLSQLTIDYPKIGLSYDFNPRLWVHLGVYGDFHITYFTVDAALRYNFIYKERYDVYASIGVSANHHNGIIIPIGTRIRPIRRYPNVSLLIEILPMLDFSNEQQLLFGSIGMQYKFGKK